MHTLFRVVQSEQKRVSAQRKRSDGLSGRWSHLYGRQIRRVRKFGMGVRERPAEVIERARVTVASLARQPVFSNERQALHLVSELLLFGLRTAGVAIGSSTHSRKHTDTQAR